MGRQALQRNVIGNAEIRREGGTFYLYFASKEDLFKALFRDALLHVHRVRAGPDVLAEAGDLVVADGPALLRALHQHAEVNAEDRPVRE